MFCYREGGTMPAEKQYSVLAADDYEAVWHNRIVDNNTIMVHISKLHNKIEENPRMPTYIKTIRGIGYQFVLPEGA